MSSAPLEYVVISFAGNRFKGEIVPALRELVDNGLIRIVDLVFIRKDADGKVEAAELVDLDGDEAAGFGDVQGDVSGLLNEEDIAIAARGLAPGSTAGLLVWETTWVTPFAEAVANANGRIVAHERIPFEVYDAALAATYTTSADAG